MPSLFQYQFKKHLVTAVESLKERCRTDNSTSDQNSFNTSTQITLMDNIHEEINAIKIPETPDWPDHKTQITAICDKYKVQAEAAKIKKQGETGKTITTKHLDDFSRKIQNIFDEMLLEINKPLFSETMNAPAELFTHTEERESAFINQLINIILNYHFDGIQDKHVRGKADFTSKHDLKYPMLCKALHIWGKVINSKIYDLEEYQFVTEALLEKIKMKEEEIEYGKVNSAVSAVFSTLTYFGKTARDKVTQTSRQLGTDLPELLERFQKNCRSLPYEVEVSAYSTAKAKAAL